MAKSKGRFLAELLGSDGKVEKAKSDAGIYAGANVTIAADGTLTTTTLPLAGGALTGAVTTNSTFDGVDIATRDAILTSTTTTAGAALPKAGGTMTGALEMGSNNITTTGKMLFANVYSATGDLPSASTYHGMFAHVHGTGKGYFAHAGSWVELANQSGLTSTTTIANAALPKAGGAMTGAITTNSTFDGVDIATRDAVLTSTTTTANAALPKAGGTMTGNLTVTGTITTTNAATTNNIFETTSNNTRSHIIAKSKDSAGNSVQLNATTVGDGPYGMLFTFTNHPLTFATNNLAPQMTLLTNGNLGIGTTTPANKLHVKAGASGATTFDARYNLTLEDDGENYIGIYSPSNSFGGVRFVNASNSIRGYIDYYHGTQGDKMQIYAQNQIGFSFPSVSQQVVFKSNGTSDPIKVGIGTTTPIENLDVSGYQGIAVNNNYAHMGSTVSGAMAIFGHNIKSDSAGNTIKSANTGYHSSMVKMYYNEGITFHATSGTATAGDTFYNLGNTTNEHMRITNTGSVGIGTSTPSERLHVQGDGADILLTDAGNGQMAKLGSTGSNNGLLEINNSAHASKVLLQASGDSYINGGNLTVNTPTSGAFPLVLTNSDTSSSTYIKYQDWAGQYWTSGINHANNDFYFNYGGAFKARFTNAGGLQIDGSGGASTPTLALNSTTSSTFNHSINAFNANLAGSENQLIVVGKEGSAKNSGYIGYKWIASGNNGNILTFGHWASDNLMNLTADGKLGIGTQGPIALLDVMAGVGSSIAMTSSHGYSQNRNWALKTNNYGSGNWGGFSIESSTSTGAAPGTAMFGIDLAGNCGIGIGGSAGATQASAKLHVGGHIRSTGQVIQGNSDGTPRFINIPYASAASGFTFDWQKLSNSTTQNDQDSEHNAFMFEVNVTSYLGKYIKAIIVVDTNATNSLSLTTLHNAGITMTASIPTGTELITLTFSGLWGNAVNFMGRITTFKGEI